MKVEIAGMPAAAAALQDLAALGLAPSQANLDLARRRRRLRSASWTVLSGVMAT